MRIALLLTIVAMLSVACSQPDKKVAAPQKERVESKYFPIRDGLYKDSAGNLFFKVIDRSDHESLEEKFLDLVWNAPGATNDEGKKEMSKVIDPASFRNLGGYFYRDTNYCYVWNDMMDGGNISVISGADVSSFTSLGEFYAKDRKHAYYLGSIIEGVHLRSFKQFSRPGDKTGRYAKDTNNYYQSGEKMSAEEVRELLKTE